MTITLRNLRRYLLSHHVPFGPRDSLSKLRRELKKYINRLRAGKRSEEQRNAQIALDEVARTDLHHNWPQVVSHSLKNELVNLFREQTSHAALSTFVCAVCAESTYNHDRFDVELGDINIDLLKPKVPLHPHVPLPYSHGPLQNVVVDPAGITVNSDTGNITLLLCKQCNSCLHRDKIPPLALANSTYLGPVPNELQDLTVIEEAMIARCRAKCWIVQLNSKEDGTETATPDVQRGMKGHIIVYPQRPSEISKLLPPSLDDIVTPVCVLFVGSSPPTPQWLREKANPLCVRREKVRNALAWLKSHNPLYHDVVINHPVLDNLEENGILPVHIEHILPAQSESTDFLTARYDESDQPRPPVQDVSSQLAQDIQHDVAFENVVVTDVEGHAPAHELRAAALRHVKRGGGYIQIPHDPTPVNEFFNPDLFPMIYPSLFPYGIGGFEDRTRSTAISMKRHVKHLFSLADRRFQEHYSFHFTAFNILQRRAALLHTSLKVRKSNFDSLASDFASVSAETVHIVTERISHGDSVTANNEEERKVLNLMKQVNTVTANVPGSSASRIAMRNEIRGLMIEKGMPSFFITINPADVYNPLVKCLAGADIDIDHLLPEEVPNYSNSSG
ncbi:hypothetical protein CVT26_015900 [Gymnopilus dilepis]|uniref:Uncharacterized protein n=1 Tax=Gymnopilus dilepis TaxID=231916 RepID=A0A409WHK2_9AGAR|nr:hypothetical protein CVT26_015900 [Gymnopilus dilepis]